MPWKVKLGDHSKLLDDFVVADLRRIAARNSEDGAPLNWLTVTITPGVTEGVAHDLVVAFAEETGQPVPPRPRTAGETRKFVNEHFDRVDDDLPTSVTESGSPLEGESTTP